jgi:hypothetical protein
MERRLVLRSPNLQTRTGRVTARPKAQQKRPQLGGNWGVVVSHDNFCEGGALNGLLQRGIDRGKHGVQVAAQAVHSGDNSKRDTRRDQTVFDRGRARFVG